MSKVKTTAGPPVREVAFLRAINVGGRTAKKEALVDAFTSLGLPNVRHVAGQWQCAL